MNSQVGLGFERFYGFMGGEVSQWHPSLYDQTTPVTPAAGRTDYHVSEDLADKAIDWIQQQKPGRDGLAIAQSCACYLAD